MQDAAYILVRKLDKHIRNVCSRIHIFKDNILNQLTNKKS